ncbi:cystatin-C-like [Dendrobates tinctorius]|uniref:cystatin-C-like n=1 Tax=Dendrobates tinctorius TaxID=92724 RepID=UPI003CCA2D2F
MAVYLYMCLIAASCLALVVTGGGMLVGGYTTINPNRDDVREAANFAVMEYNEGSNDANLYKLSCIKSAQSQVVAGTNYKLDLDIGRSSCTKNHADNCDLANSEVSQVKHCTCTVFKSLPPKVTFSLTNFSCDF